MKHGPIDKDGASALAEAKAMTEIAEVLAPLSREQRWCPACGAGWYGTDAEVAQAERAWQAYELLCEMGEM